MTRHPPGVYLLSATELWERFSYYALAGMLTLFLSSPASEGGFGWPDGTAVQLFGLISGAAFAAPALGGWLVSRWFREQPAIVGGGIAIAAGQGLLALTAWRGPDAQGAMAALWTALLLIVGGTALLKPAVSAAVGFLYAPQDRRRDGGYAIFMAGVWAGSFFSNLIAGTIGELFGWAWGFATAMAGMSLGMIVFVVLRRRLLGCAGNGGDRAIPAAPRGDPGVARADRTPLLGLALISLFTVAYAAAFYQKGGFLSVLIRQSVDRGIGAFTVPATWFLSISTGIFILAAPLVSRWIERRALAGHSRLDVCTSLVIGLGLLSGGYAIFAIGAADAIEGRIAMAWFVLGYMVFGVADVFIWPPQIALASRLAPAHLASFVIGVWYLSIGVGSYLSGLVGATALHMPAVTALAGLCAALLCATLAAWLARPKLLSMISARGDA